MTHRHAGSEKQFFNGHRLSAGEAHFANFVLHGVDLNPKKYLRADTIQTIDIIYESYDPQKILGVEKCRK
jgi:hypothetical protein